MPYVFNPFTGDLDYTVSSAGGGGSGDMTKAVYDPALVSEQLVGLTAIQVLSGKTLTSPVINTGVSGTAIDVDSTMAANSDTKLASQKATKTALATKEPTITAGTTAQYWRGDKSWQTLDKTAVGLANVDNTSDLNKPISTATQTALNLKEDLSNKSTSLGTSATLYVTQSAVNTLNVFNQLNFT